MKKIERLKNHVNGLEVILIAILVVVFINYYEIPKTLRFVFIILPLIGLFIRPLIRQIGFWWMIGAVKVSTQLGKVVLTIVYFSFFYPLSLIFRLTSKKSPNGGWTNYEREINYKTPW